MTCKKLVSEFESLNKTAADVQYKKCKILFTIKDQYLYQELGYISFQEFVENELSITRATANRYCKFYSLVYWHDYSKNDAVRLITVLGVSSAVTAMESNNRGASVTHAIASSKSYNRYQMPLTITDSDMQMIEDTLERFGAPALRKR